MQPFVGHFKSIDGLRAWMAWWVVLQHILQLGGMKYELPTTLYRLLTSGGVAVDVFIIVSGYVICHLLLSERESYRIYIVRRLLRLYPLYLFALLFSFCTRDIYVDVFTAHSWIEGVQYRAARAMQESEELLAHIVLHLSLLHGVVPDSLLPHSSTAFLAPAWSLSLEWQFYIVAPLIMLVFAVERRLLAMMVATVLLLLVVSVYLSGWQWEVPANLFLSLGYFLVGMSTRYAIQGGLRQTWIALVIAVIGFMFAVHFKGMNFLLDLMLALMIWGVTMIAVFSEKQSKNASPLWYSRLLQPVFSGSYITEIGKWSYSTYLLHLPILTLAVFLINSMGFDGRYSYVIAMFLSIPLILYASRLSYAWLEKPAIVYGKKLAEKGRKDSCEAIGL